MLKRRPILIVFLIILVIFQGVSGVFGGAGLIIDPSGKSLQIPLEWLNGSHFDNYFIPGIVLFFVLGITPLIISFGLIKRKYWSWYGSLFWGFALIIWILVEIIVIGFQADPPLQLIYGIVGVAILMLTFTRSVKNYFLSANN